MDRTTLIRIEALLETATPPPWDRNGTYATPEDRELTVLLRNHAKDMLIGLVELAKSDALGKRLIYHLCNGDPEQLKAAHRALVAIVAKETAS